MTDSNAPKGPGSEKEKPAITVGSRVWAKRNGLSRRATVAEIVAGKAWVRAIVDGHTWTVDLSSLVPVVDSTEVAKELVEQQREGLAQASIHLAKARRLARGEED